MNADGDNTETLDSETSSKMPVESSGPTTTIDYTFSVPPNHQQTIYQLDGIMFLFLCCVYEIDRTDIQEKNIQKFLRTAEAQHTCDVCI